MKHNTNLSVLLLLLLLSILMISQSCQKEDEKDNNSSVQNTPPVASFTVSPSSGNTETLFEFDASGSSDKEDALSVLKVRWDWENDGGWDTDWSANKIVIRKFLTHDTITISMEVKDRYNLYDIAKNTIIVQSINTPPSAYFTIKPTTGNTSTIFDFDASYCIDYEDTVANLEVRWDFNGDGIWDTNWDYNKLVNYQYNEEGNYSIRFEVKDSYGLTDFLFKKINISKTCDGNPTVYYQGQTYHTALIGNQCWMKENLNVGKMIDGLGLMTDNGIIEKYCYNNNPKNCDLYGGLYSWNELMDYSEIEGSQGICPSGWHIPTKHEWYELSEFVGGSSIAGKNLKSTDGWGTLAGEDTYGFSAIKTGLRWSYGIFDEICCRTDFWSSTKYGYPLYRKLYYDSNEFFKSTHPVAIGKSARCIRDY